MTLALAGIFLGALTMSAFRRIAKPREIRGAMNRIQAHLLEFWLYQDEPSMIWRSWKGLIAANVRFLRLLVLPLLILAVPMTPLYFFLDALYGTSPLLVNQPAVVTLSISVSEQQAMQAPDGISIDGPPVRVYSERQVSWRIRPSRPLSGELQWRIGDTQITKSIAAGTGSHVLSRRRTQSLFHLIRYPTEAPLPAGPVDWIEVSYPAADITLLGIEAHWSMWFLIFSVAGALLAMRIGKLR